MYVFKCLQSLMLSAWNRKLFHTLPSPKYSLSSTAKHRGIVVDQPQETEIQGWSFRSQVQGEVDGAERLQSLGKFSDFLENGWLKCLIVITIYVEIKGNKPLINIHGAAAMAMTSLAANWVTVSNLVHQLLQPFKIFHFSTT